MASVFIDEDELLDDECNTFISFPPEVQEAIEQVSRTS